MATSGSIKDTGSFATATLSWSRTSVDTANNKSTISYTLSLSRTYNISSSASKDYSIKINGSTVASGTTTIGGSGTKTIKSGSVTIPHNSDGTKTFSFSFSLEMAVTLSGTYVGTLSASGSSTLDSIPRTSKPTLSSTSVNYGSSVTIYTNRASDSFTHTLRWAWNGETGTIATGVTTSKAWTVPTSFMNYIPNATSSWGTIYCDTYSGSTKIGTESIKLTTNVPSSVVPTFSGITHSETVTSVSTLMGSGNPYVQGMSKIKLTVSGASGAYSSTIKSYKIEFDGSSWTSSSATTGVVKSSGTLTAKATITDSRGRTASKTASITVLPYSPPKVTAFSVTRSNSDGSVNEVGTYAKVTRSASVSSLKVGTTEKNTLTYTIKTKPRSSSTWTTNVASTTLGAGTISLTGTNNIGTFDITTSYDLRIEVSDKFNTTISLAVISTGQVTMSWGATGIGVGKVWEKGALDVRGDVFIDGKLNVNKVIMTDGINSKEAISAITGDSNGIGLNMSAGGLMVVGSGESADNYVTAKLAEGWKGGTEQTAITSDGHVYIETAMQGGYAGRYTWQFTSGGNLFFPHTGGIYMDSYGNLKAQNTISTTNNWNVMDEGGSSIIKVPLHSSAYTGTNSPKPIELGQFQFYGGYNGTSDSTNKSVLVFRAYSSDNWEYILMDDSTNGFYFGADSKPAIGGVGAGNAELFAKKFNVVSDRDVKENIEEFSTTALDLVRGAKAYRYDHKLSDAWKARNPKKKLKKSIGLVAQEAPVEITTDAGTGIDLYAMNTVLWKAVQELSEQVEYLQKKMKRK